MSDDLTRAIAEATGEHVGVKFYDSACFCTCKAMLWTVGDGFTAGNLEHPPGTSVAEVALTHHQTEVLTAALAPLIEARVREARAEALEDAAGSIQINNWVDIFKGPLPERLGNAQRAVDWLRERAKEAAS